MKGIANPPAIPAFPTAYAPPVSTPDHVLLVRDLPQLIERILTLKPHEQVEMVVSTGNMGGGGGQSANGLEERGYLMDIRVGPESNVCVKRTF